jgi:hypothetical protein
MQAHTASAAEGKKLQFTFKNVSCNCNGISAAMQVNGRGLVEKPRHCCEDERSRSRGGAIPVCARVGVMLIVRVRMTTTAIITLIFRANINDNDIADPPTHMLGDPRSFFDAILGWYVDAIAAGIGGAVHLILDDLVAVRRRALSTEALFHVCLLDTHTTHTHTHFDLNTQQMFIHPHSP